MEVGRRSSFTKSQNIGSNLEQLKKPDEDHTQISQKEVKVYTQEFEYESSSSGSQLVQKMTPVSDSRPRNFFQNMDRLTTQPVFQMPDDTFVEGNSDDFCEVDDGEDCEVGAPSAPLGLAGMHKFKMTDSPVKFKVAKTPSLVSEEESNFISITHRSPRPYNPIGSIDQDQDDEDKVVVIDTDDL
jgi:hypothetical protein